MTTASPLALRFVVACALAAATACGGAGHATTARPSSPPDASAPLRFAESSPTDPDAAPSSPEIQQLPRRRREARLDERLDQLDLILSPRATVRGSGATNPAPARPRRTPTTFPARSAVATIRAYAFNGTYPCAGNEPFARDGRLCDDVILPASELSLDERNRVLDLFDAARAEEHRGAHLARGEHFARRIQTRCDFAPHHALVMFDARGDRLATIPVCFTCGEWQSQPPLSAIGGLSPTVMETAERAVVREVLDQHGLFPWAFIPSDLRELIEYEAAVYGPPRHRTPIGLPGVTRTERR
jgi:hypothetical protein